MELKQRKALLRRQNIRKKMGLETRPHITLLEAALLVATVSWWRE